MIIKEIPLVSATIEGINYVKDKEMRFRMIRQLALFIMTLSSLSVAFAADYESIEHINEITKSFLLESYAHSTAEKIEIKVNPAHAPIEVTKCSQDIMPAIPKNASGSQIASVELTCDGENKTGINITKI